MLDRGDGLKEIVRGDRWYYSYLPNGIAGGATSVLIPLFALALGASAAEVGIIAASSSVASVPAFMLWGRLSDRLGKRRAFAVLGFSGTAISFLFMSASRSVSELYLSNVLLGAFASASAPVGTVLIMETAQRKEWPERLAFFSQIGAIGFITGMGMGALWLHALTEPWGSESSVRGLFFVSGVLVVVSVLMALRWIRDPELGVKRSTIPLSEHIYMAVERVKYLPLRLLHYFDFTNHAERKHVYSKSLKLYYVVVLLIFAGFTAFYAMFPIYLAGPVGFGGSEIFAVFIASQGVSALVYPRIGRWISRLGARRAQIVGATARVVLFPSFLSLAVLPMGHGSAFVLAILVHGLVGVSWALINVSGSTIVSKLAPPGGHAQTFGLYNAVQGVGSIIGPLLGGFVTEALGYEGGFFLSSLLILAGVIVLVRLALKED